MSQDSNIYVLPIADEYESPGRKVFHAPKIPLLPIRLLTAVLGLLLFTGSLDLIIPSVLMTLIRYGVFALSLFFIFGFYVNKFIQTICRDRWLFIILLMACLSFVWSDYPDSTTSECFELFRVSIFALFLSISFSPQQKLNLLLLNFCLGAILCAMIAVAVPSIGVDHVIHIGAWQGIYGNKNAMGAMMAVSSLLFFISLLFSGRDLPLRKLLLWCGLILSAFLVLMTTSKTSLVVLCTISLSVTAYRRYRWKGKASVIFLLLASLVSGLVGVFIVSNWSVLIGSLGRDPTLTGRTIIWKAALEQFLERPWYGFGQGAFWAVGSEQQIYVARFFSLNLDYLPPHAHNGFLEILLSLGAIGMLFFAINFSGNMVLALKRAYLYKSAADWFPLTLLFLLISINLTESQLMRTTDDGIFWILYIVVSTSLKCPVDIYPEQTLNRDGERYGIPMLN
ncbi:MAG: O-antigen ligase family protein [Synechococcus sp.]